MTKKLGRGLGMATLVLALVGVPALSAYADSDPVCNYPYYNCSPTTTQAGTGNNGGGTPGTGNSGGHSGKGTLPPITKSAGGSGSSGTGSGTATGSGSGVSTVSTKAAGGGSLPFTGADIEEMTIGGVGALLLGGLLLRRSRSRRRASV